MSKSPIDEVIDANTAESSPADDEVAKPSSMLEAVQAAVSDGEEAATTTDAEEEERETEVESEVVSGEETSADETTDIDDEQPPFHEHPRWQQMLQENRTLKEDKQRLTEYDNYFNATGLSAEELDTGVNIMKLLRDDPIKAAELLNPMIEQVQRFNGQGPLPDDLQDDVDAGRITEDRALELSKARSQAEFYQRNSETQAASRAEREEADRQRAAQESATAIQTAVTDWETQWKTSDPDFSKKHQRVRDRVIAMVHENGRPPTSAAEALEWSNKARKDVEAEIKAMFPGKESKRTVSGGSSASATPEPASLREAIEQGLAAGNG